MSVTAIEESQMPRLTENDDWFHFISERAAQLNAYGDDFEDLRSRLSVEPVVKKAERHRTQAEIDAAAFHAYGHDRESTKFILDDFHRVSSPRIMTEDYFDMVFDKYDLLEQEGPHS